MLNPAAGALLHFFQSDTAMPSRLLMNGCWPAACCSAAAMLIAWGIPGFIGMCRCSMCFGPTRCVSDASRGCRRIQATCSWQLAESSSHAVIDSRETTTNQDPKQDPSVHLHGRPVLCGLKEIKELRPNQHRVDLARCRSNSRQTPSAYNLNIILYQVFGNVKS